MTSGRRYRVAAFLAVLAFGLGGCGDSPHSRVDAPATTDRLAGNTSQALPSGPDPTPSSPRSSEGAWYCGSDPIPHDTPTDCATDPSQAQSYLKLETGPKGIPGFVACNALPPSLAQSTDTSFQRDPYTVSYGDDRCDYVNAKSLSPNFDAANDVSYGLTLVGSKGSIADVIDTYGDTYVCCSRSTSDGLEAVDVGDGGEYLIPRIPGEVGNQVWWKHGDLLLKLSSDFDHPKKAEFIKLARAIDQNLD